MEPTKKVHPYALKFHVLFFAVFFCCYHPTCSQKLRYASSIHCDRHSLDAVYHEKYKLITSNIFADTKEFMSRVSDLVADSLTSIMADLPDRDVSTNEERHVYTQFKNLKNALSSRMKKQQRNITSAWEELLVLHFDLMFDNKNASLQEYVNKTVRMTDSYSSARRALDSILTTFINFIRGTVDNGIGGIRAVSEEALKKEKEEKKEMVEEDNKEENEQENEDQSFPFLTKVDNDIKKEEKNTEKSSEDVLRSKMVEIAQSIVPGFLGNLTVQVIERRLDTVDKKTSTVDPDSRDSVLDDILFDMLMVKNRIKALVRLDVPKDKGEVNLARRSIYTYWAEVADEMYKERIKTKKSSSSSSSDESSKSSGGRLFYRNLWKDEKQLLGTLLDLIEMYP